MDRVGARMSSCTTTNALPAHSMSGDWTEIPPTRPHLSTRWTLVSFSRVGIISSNRRIAGAAMTGRVHPGRTGLCSDLSPPFTGCLSPPYSNEELVGPLRDRHGIPKAPNQSDLLPAVLMCLRLRRLCPLLSFIDAFDQHFRNDETQAHRQNDDQCGHAARNGLTQQIRSHR